MMNKIKYFMENYYTINDSNFGGNEIGKILTKDINDTLKAKLKELKIDDIKEVKASIGRGRKAEVPWENVQINDMKDENTFINFVIFFSADSKIMYLTLNQKFDFYQGSNTEKMNKAKEFANKMVKILLENNITIPSDMYKGSIDLRCKGDTARGYEKTTMLYKKYEIENLPTDEQFMKDVVKFIDMVKTIKRIKGSKTITNFINDVLNNKFEYKVYTEDKEEIKKEMKKYYEGKKRTRTVTTSSPIRNKNLANDYKEYLKEKQNGKIWCEVCKRYENIPQILEVHHKIEISNYEKENKEYTTFDDVILLCPTCHSILHLVGNLEEIEKYILD